MSGLTEFTGKLIKEALKAVERLEADFQAENWFLLFFSPP